LLDRTFLASQATDTDADSNDADEGGGKGFLD